MDQVSVKGKSKFEAVKINSKLDICDKNGHPLRLRRWPEQLAICFLCRARVRTSDFSGFFELIVLIGYVTWIFLLSIALS